MRDKAIWAVAGLLTILLYWAVDIAIKDCIQDSNARQTYAQACTQRGGVVVYQRNAKPLCIDNKFLMEVK